MRLKKIHVFFAVFLVMSFVIFVAINENPEWQMKKHSDAILVFLITVLSIFIIFDDFRIKIPLFRMAMPVFIFIVINVGLVVAVYLMEATPSVGIIIPFFMAEGAMVYWWLDKRISTRDD